ncbi:MAG: AI-2E family transporter, partial [Clostridia bacterium]|nr:AI-2E family transporter [Clostridia bacterium]
IKSYLVLMLVTFAELTLGFTLIGIRRAPLAAFIISFIDLLPVLGSWTVLIPWGVLSIIAGNAKVGAGLLILEAVVYTVRQFAEPHIVGSIVGVHPIVTLLSAFAGYVLLGVAGVIFVPIGVYLAKAVLTDEEPKTVGSKKIERTPDG